MDNVIEGFELLTGKHCVTNSIQQIFNYNDLNLSEEMIFGLAEGLNFFYFDFKNLDYPMIGGRSKLFEFEKNLASNLGIEIKINKTTSIKKAYRSLQKNIKNNNPLMVYVDMGELEYLYLPEGYHFGGHSIVVFGLVESQDEVYISDRDGKKFKITMRPEEEPDDYHVLSMQELKRARNSQKKPYPPKNRWLEFKIDNMRELNEEILKPVIKRNVKAMIDPPIRNLGVKGIKKFSELLIKDWPNFSLDKLKEAAFNTFIFINQIGGTGGGIFRKMYGDFLIESGEICNDKNIERLGNQLKKVGEKWDKVGYKFHEIFKTEDYKILESISEDLNSIYEEEKQLFNQLYQYLNG